MFNLHPNILKKNGKKEFAILPFEEFEKIKTLLEDYEDILALREAKEKEDKLPTVSLSEARKLLELEE